MRRGAIPTEGPHAHDAARWLMLAGEAVLVLIILFVCFMVIYSLWAKLRRRNK